MQFSFRRAGDTVGWPRIYVIRFGGCFREVLARIDVPVLRGPYQRVFGALFGDKPRNALGDGGTAFNTKCSTLTKGWLHINDQQCPRVLSHDPILPCHTYAGHGGRVPCASVDEVPAGIDRKSTRVGRERRAGEGRAVG